MKTIVTGASGFVGSYFHDLYGRRGDRVIGTTHSKKIPGLVQIDLTQGTQVERLLKLERPDVVVHCAAMPNVDACQENPVDSYGANVIATQNLARVCSDMGSKLVFISSDYVFNGRDRPSKGYTENSVPDPVNVYGEHKLEAEQVVFANPTNLVLRVTVVYGWEKGMPKNFFHTLVENLRRGEKRRVPLDQEGTPIYVRDLVAIADELIRQKASGIYNVAGPKIMSRYNFALAIAWTFNSGDYSLIESVFTDRMEQKAPRGLKLGLDISKTSGITLHRPLAPLEALVKLKKEERL